MVDVVTKNDKLLGLATTAMDGEFTDKSNSRLINIINLINQYKLQELRKAVLNGKFNILDDKIPAALAIIDSFMNQKPRHEEIEVFMGIDA